MALGHCPECYKVISSEAKSCPHCGYRPKGPGCGKFILYAVIFIIGGNVFFSILPSPSDNLIEDFRTNESENQALISETIEQKKVALKNFSKEDVARFTISSVMGQPSKKIKVKKEGELYYVSYVRKSDSQKFKYKIKIDGNRIVWANIDGRWRDGDYDERISFEEADNKLKITQTFSDGSGDTKEFKVGE